MDGNSSKVLLDSYWSPQSLFNIFGNVLATGVIILITVLILISNVSNIVIIVKARESYGVTAYLMISLALADLGVGVLAAPFSIAPSIYHKWMYSWQWCGIMSLIVASLCSISIVMCTLMTIEKYVYIVHPLKYDKLLKPWNCIVYIVLTWVINFSLYTTRYFLGGTNIYIENTYVCVWEFKENLGFTCYIYIANLLLPVSAIGCCNYQIYKVARRHALEIQSVTQPFTSNDSIHAARSETLPHVQQRRALKMIIFITATFYTAWIPFAIMKLVSIYQDVEIPAPIDFILTWFTYANSFCNSIIYFHFNSTYRKNAVKMWRWIFCQCTKNGVPRDFRMNESVGHTEDGMMSHIN